MSAVTMKSNSETKPSIFRWIADHWFAAFLFIYGLWVFTPFLAPVFMNIGWSGAGKAIYFIYSFFCHQLPERSFFFFGAKSMYSLSEIQAAWQDTVNPMILRQFIGNETMGWKIAWSDRMISFYTSIWLFALLWFPFRRRMKALSWWGLLLLLLPMAVDGGTHAISDLAGIGQGFRDTNMWLAALTNNSLPAAFYAGDARGSFNSVMRFLTGLLAGLGIVWFAFPYIFRAHAASRQPDESIYVQALEQVKRQDPHPSGR
ncbi:MAG TPA: DUF2085 domain-containing protein [Anaerolineales bacterium]|nr:DUF2085 domain-containing protein [Anaerolineales bacterium]